MRPFIWPGGTLLVRRCEPDDLAVGDIAVWFDGARMLSHRVVARTPAGVVTRGDWLARLDEPFAPEQLVGVAVAFASARGLGFRLDTRAARAWSRVAAPSARAAGLARAVIARAVQAVRARG